MHVIKSKRILEYCDEYPEASQALLTWYQFVKRVRWEKPPDVREFSNSADFIEDARVVFNINGNHYRLIVDIYYASGEKNGTVLIRWFGTHKEYDRINVRLVK
jgi:mRNA interferase HigB